MDSAVTVETDEKPPLPSAKPRSTAFTKTRRLIGRKMSSGTYYQQMLAIERAKLRVQTDLLAVTKNYYAEKIALLRENKPTQQPCQSTYDYDANGHVYQNLN